MTQHIVTLLTRQQRNHYNKCNPERMKKIAERYNSKPENKVKVKARYEARQGKNKIKLEGLCQKCNKEPAIQRHHIDYSRPLDVILLCKECHIKEHPK